MRQKLGQFENVRVAVTATFDRYGSTKRSGDTTMLFTDVNIMGEFGKGDYDNPIFIDDHCWLVETQRLEKVKVKSGDKVRFVAIVDNYLKVGENASEKDYNFNQVRGFRVEKDIV